jgi:hypothetical protein
VGDAAGATREQLAAAFSDEIAGVYWVSDGLEPGVQLAEVIDIAHAHGVPVLVDASNTLPPAEHLYEFVEMGAVYILFSLLDRRRPVPAPTPAVPKLEVAD